MAEYSADVVVIGAGLAGLAAALSAREQGAGVIVLERAPEDERGGNTRFSMGAMRAIYNGIDDVEALVGEIGPTERARCDFGSYTREEYLDVMASQTQYRTDPDLSEILVDRSGETMLWLRQNGVKFMPLYAWQQPQPDGRIKFSGGSAVEVYGGGETLSETLFATALSKGVKILYSTRATALIDKPHGIAGVTAKQGRRSLEVEGRSVVLASGGFQANTEWRTRYLGPSWDLAKLRGSRFNTGDGLRMALDVGAMPFGHWSGCHSASWNLNAPDIAELGVGGTHKRDDFIFGIMVNKRGERFVDEGSDVRALIYASMGRAILAQPGQVAWQVYDNKVLKYLHKEYRMRNSARLRADTLEELAGKMEDIDRKGFLRTVEAYNRAVQKNVPFHPGKKDGRGTEGLAVPKSNWAQTIDEPPFEAYAVTGGITFTFGGLRIDTSARVLDTEGAPIPGLYAAGEMVGGLFYFNYPGGAGLMSVAVFGRIAGVSAAKGN